ncbi:unnamed protein product [Effrenium voratum]|uniref:Uncharacterized protein n=1 Tax=Effrenium voratum TaxID=2562239 RepID=A0AA36MP30_9DINO|nr:unnamed protein product [Effrenium voratum]CAJ1441482.1 unnamed protein product [Effrenium voratum]
MPHSLRWLLPWLLRAAGDEFAADQVSTPRDNVQVANAGESCHLANLFLHALADDDGVADPIDLRPKKGAEKAYEATLDYSMAGYHILATASPRESCQISSMSTSAVMLDPGDSSMSELFVEPKAGAGLDAGQYLLNVSRLSGAETQLRKVAVGGAYMVPGWSPEVRRYTVYLNLEEDLVRFQVAKLDNGQAVEMVAELEEADADLHSRRLAGKPSGEPAGDHLGEQQHETATLLTTLDVGHKRTVQIQVTSADKAQIRNYYFTVRRPPCPSERRFFDGEEKLCTDICNENLYGSSTTGRCTRCMDEHCAICQAMNCSLCFEGYELQHGLCVVSGAGSGKAALHEIEEGVSSYAWKHQTLVLVAGTVLLATLCACGTVCLCHSTSRTRRAPLLDEEDNPFEYYEESARG